MNDKTNSNCKDVFVYTRKEKKHAGFFLSGILLLTIIVFSGVRNNGFIANWDDGIYVINNPYIKDLSFISIKNIFTDPYFSNYHPLTTLVYAIEYYFFQLDPLPYHIVNLALHLVNIILVFYFILFFSGRIIASVFISLLFAIHPMHVESVVWISELKDVLYAVFFLLALITYIKYIRNSKAWLYYVLSIVFFILSLYSKSMAVSLPLIILLIDYYKSRKLSLKLIIEKLPFFGLSLYIGIMTFNAQKMSGALEMIPTYSLIDKIYIISYSMVFYVVKMIAPLNLSAYHFFPIKTGSMLPFIYYITPLIPALIIWWIVRAKGLKKELIFGFLFYLFTIILVVQIIPVGESMVSERYTYIPFLGLFYVASLLPCILAAVNLDIVKKIRRFFLYFFMVYVLLLSVHSYMRVGKWETAVILFDDLVKKYPDHYHSYFQRGSAKYDAMDINGAIRDFNKSIQLNPRNNMAYMNRGICKAIKNNYNSALEDLNKSVEINPFYSRAYFNRGNIYYNYGLAIRNLQCLQQAILDYSKTIEIDRYFLDAMVNRGYVKQTLGDINGACEDWEYASNLGSMLAKSLIDQYCR